MERVRKSFWRLLLFVQALLLLQAGCAGVSTPGGGNLAAPPAPIAEIPSAIQIPSDLSIDVDKALIDSPAMMLATYGDPYVQEAVTKLIGGAGGVCGDGTLDADEQCDDGDATDGTNNCSAQCKIENYSEEVAFSANLVVFTDGRLRALLGPLSVIRIPVDPNLRNMETVVYFGDQPFIARFDFSDFDLDGVNGAEGCSGHTAQLPICIRVWLDNREREVRLLAARFDQFPLPENPGAGSLRGKDITFANVNDIDSPVQVAANYDHFDPLDKFTEAYFGFLFDSMPGEVGLPIHSLVSQVGPDESALKTSSGTSADGDEFGRTFGRWYENQDYWLGSFETNSPPPRQFTDQCVHLVDGQGVDFEAFCAPLGLSTSGLQFLPLTRVEDLLFYDFPALAP